MKTQSLVFSFLSVLVLACNKEEGRGGTSTIRGKVVARSFEPAKSEQTEIIVSEGAALEHGEYFIINNVAGGTFYYVWYNNPTWITNGDPNLEGRTGIEVGFNYSDSNIDIATATFNAIVSAASADLSISLSNDVLLITHKAAGSVPDANNMTTSFEVNIADQGEDKIWSNETPGVNERVYIVYGDNTFYGDEVRTGGEGDYEFTNLVKGNYTIYVVSQDTLNPDQTIKNSAVLTISENKELVEVSELEVIK